MIKKHFFFMILALLIPSAYSIPEVTVINDNTLLLHRQDSIYLLNNSPKVYDPEGITPVQMWETDDEVSIQIYAQNKKFHRLTITNAIDNQKRPVYYCYNNNITNYFWNQEESEFCENYAYSARLRDLGKGQSLQFEVPDIVNLSCGTNPDGTNCTYESNAWSIWVGKGAGGGGGLPLCEGLTITWSVTSTGFNGTGGQFDINNYHIGAWRVWYIGSTYVGCTPQSWRAEQKPLQGIFEWKAMLSPGTTYWYTPEISGNSTTQNASFSQPFGACSGTPSLGSGGNCIHSALTANNVCTHNWTSQTRAWLRGIVQNNVVTVTSTEHNYTIFNPNYAGNDVCVDSDQDITPLLFRRKSCYWWDFLRLFC